MFVFIYYLLYNYILVIYIILVFTFYVLLSYGKLVFDLLWRPLPLTTRIRQEVTSFQDPVDEEVRNVTGVETRKLPDSQPSEAPRQVARLDWTTLVMVDLCSTHRVFQHFRRGSLNTRGIRWSEKSKMAAAQQVFIYNFGSSRARYSNFVSIPPWHALPVYL